MNLAGDSSNPNVPAVSAVHSTNGKGVAASSAQGIALEATATNDTAVFAHSNTGRGVDARSAQSIALEATATNDTAVFAHSTTGRGVDARSARSIALEATATNDTAVFAHSTSGRGVDARSAQSIALEATATNDTAVFAHSDTGRGVDGRSNGAEGVHGETNSATSAAVVGINNAFEPTNNATGVLGTCGIAGNAIHGVGGTNAGLFDGHVQINGGLDVTGELTVLGAKHFRIDHPCDPANKYLFHCSVEAPEMINVYSGNVITDEVGTVTVLLPNYFEALNCDFRYQLTVIGQFAQAFIAEEIVTNRFVIKTDKPNVKISWQISGVRKDFYAEANPVVVEKEKSATEKGSRSRQPGGGYRSRQPLC
jgi:hypothetical protein